MIINGHHTCSTESDAEKIEKDGPFQSVHETDDSQKNKFLGTGYYFWDNNIGMAHSWGKRRYKDKYYIFDAKLKVNSKNFLDLVGNREQQIWFNNIIKQFEPYLDNEDEWTVGNFIHFLRLKNSEPEFKGIFPFKVIRAVDNSIDIAEKYKIRFSSGHRGFTGLTPIYIICLTELDWNILISFKLHKS